MNFEDVPLIGQVLESGAEDRVLDGLLVAGPLVVGLLAVSGRNLLTDS